MEENTPREQIGQLARSWADLEQQFEIVKKTNENQAVVRASIAEAHRLLDERRRQLDALADKLNVPFWRQLLDTRMLEKLTALTTPLAPSPAAVLMRLIDDETARRQQIRTHMKKNRFR
jgi:hypothetical protein